MKTILLLIFLLVSVGPVSADRLYIWTDENGVSQGSTTKPAWWKEEKNWHQIKPSAVSQTKRTDVKKTEAISLNPGNYDIKHWIELPGGGSGKLERDIAFIRGSEDVLYRIYNGDGCDLLSKSITGRTLRCEFKCNLPGVDRISISFTFEEDSFKGTVLYKKSGSEMRVGIRGKRIGATPESKPQPISAEKLDEIDKKLRNLWGTMTSYLSSGNLDKALELIHPVMRKERAVLFQALKDKWPTMVKEQVDFRRLDIDDDNGFAHYDLITHEKNGEHSYEAHYEVLFQKDQDDHWYIVDF